MPPPKGPQRDTVLPVGRFAPLGYRAAGRYRRIIVDTRQQNACRKALAQLESGVNPLVIFRKMRCRLQSWDRYRAKHGSGPKQKAKFVRRMARAARDGFPLRDGMSLALILRRQAEWHRFRTANPVAAQKFEDRLRRRPQKRAREKARLRAWKASVKAAKREVAHQRRMADRRAVAHWCRICRRLMGWTQKGLAERAQMKREHVKAVETCQRSTGPLWIRRLAEAFRAGSREKSVRLPCLGPME